MAALRVGGTAPDFKLVGLHKEAFSLSDALLRGPVVLAFFKVSCPTCQYAFPFYERLFQAYKGRGVTLIGISQNNPEDTAAFAKEFGITFPLLLDDPITYPVSTAYGLTHVPTLYWINQAGDIEVSSVGWAKPDFEELNRRMAEAGSVMRAPIFHAGEDVRDFRGG